MNTALKVLAHMARQVPVGEKLTLSYEFLRELQPTLTKLLSVTRDQVSAEIYHFIDITEAIEEYDIPPDPEILIDNIMNIFTED